MKGRQWDEETDITLMRLRDLRRLPWAEIARQIDRTESASRSRYSKIRGGRPRVARVHAEPVPNVRVTPAQIADRDARMEASWRRSQTQEFFGDPPPGFSCLDRKRQAETQSR